MTAEPGERRRVRYRLRSAPMQVAQQFLAALARDWDGPLDALRDHLSRQPAINLEGIMNDHASAGLPVVADRATFQAELDALRVREKAHTREGDAIAAARRRLPMVEMDPAIPLTGPAARSPCWKRSRADGS